MKKLFFLSLAFLVVSLVAFIYAASNPTFISNVGTVKTVNVGAYKDFGCMVPLTAIDWGFVEPGSVVTRTAYIRNEANVPVVLSLATQDWSPLNASNFIELTWDYEGGEIAVDGVVQVVFSLTTSAEISGVETFSFNIVIVGEG